MLVSGIQRITLLSCLILSMTLFFPKVFLSGEKEKVVLQSEAAGPGNLPMLRFRHEASTGDDDDDDDECSPESLSTSQKLKIFSQTKTFQKSSLLSHVAPIYGFGIFLYIIYVFYKLTDKHRATGHHCSFSILIPEHTAQETREFISDVALNSVCCPGHRSAHEERKLQHMMKITQILVEGQMLDDVTPEVEAEETPYTAHWEGYPEETFPQYEVPLSRYRYPSIILEEPHGDVPTPEELAERMQREEEEDETDEDTKGMKDDGELEKREQKDDNEDDADEEDYKQDEEEEEESSEDQPCLVCNSTDKEKIPDSGNQKEGETPGRKRQITFSNHRHIFHYPKGGAVGCRYEDEEVEEEAPEDDNDDDDDDDDYDYDVIEEKQDEDDDVMEMEEEMEMEEDDPLMEAERLGFSTRFTCDPEEQEVDLIDFLLMYKPEAVIKSEQSGAAEAPGLRMRCKNQKKEN
ncbi:hypothetical protein KOW79_008712 [Hemibagrus wyckioides]|uniref:Resistance to inhibitors of cholinesterase protein 3 N-terminal domain-containing protein n=1 Tax=Hemibagrus wyckioides TaxID=337641 RepID=A0A9D3NR61_9TELE|nr:hypothetical protein KOW79_008712 [Hemibagrus wyckioides]